MKFILSFLTTILIVNLLHAQLVQIKGTIRCTHRGSEATQGAQRVIIKPLFDPSKSVMTSTDPSGYFILNTGLNYENVKESGYTLVLISKCVDCDGSIRHVFIDKPTIVITRWRLERACEETEMPPSQLESYLVQLQKDKPVKEKKPSTTAAAGVAAPSFINLLTEVITAATATFPPDGGGKFFANKLGPSRMHYGEFLAASAFYNTSNIGFNFAPDRDVSEAIFWNPAVMSTTFKKSNLSAFSNFRGIVKAQLFSKILPRLSSGFGFLYQNQEEFRTVHFWKQHNNIDPRFHKAIVDSVSMKLKEYAIYTSISYAFDKKVSTAISLKYIHQNFTVPLRLNRQIGNFAFEKEIEYFDSSVTKKGPELDVSFNYNVSYAFQIGINFMNLLGSTLHSDAFVPRSDTAAFKSPKLSQFRGVGIGASYKLHRFNFGTDIILDHQALYEISLGANFIPFNKALIYGGYSFKQSSYSFGIRLSHFRIGYINDNGYTINDVRQPKKSFFDGRIYGGLVIDGWDSN